MSQRRKRKLESKYLVRRVVFVLLVTVILALGVWWLWGVLGLGDKPEDSSSQSSPESLSQSQQEPSSSQGQEEGTSSQSTSSGEPSSGESEEESVPVDAQGDWRLVLVNPTHAIDSEPDIQLTDINGYQFDSRIVQNIQDLLAAAKEDGINLTIISGYRTLERSRILYANKVAEYEAMGYDNETAKVEAAKWVAPPGTSEHHTGLAMDIVSSDYYTKYSDLVEEFANDPEAIWLKENCARFGFILRYPQDKVDITGINFEPWHFRYVGEEHAAKIMEQGICLEEYLGETD